MRKFLYFLLIISLTLSLSGCFFRNKTQQDFTENTGSTNENNQNSGSDSETGGSFNQTMLAVSVPAVTENTVADDGTVIFQYTHQYMQLVLHKPQVADKIIVDFLKRVDSTVATAESTSNSAKSVYNGQSSWTPYQYHVTYSPVRLDHQVLSMFGHNVVYAGSGHPERTCVSASYDIQSGDVLTLASIMSVDATSQKFCTLVLNGLKKIATDKHLYKGYEDTVKQRFSIDPSQDEGWYFTTTGLCFYFAPYEIAPYSSGVITVELPYTDIKNFLHPDYVPSIEAETKGNVTISPFNPETANPDDYSNIAEIVMDKSGDMYMVETDGQIQDIRVNFTDNAGTTTIFAAYNLVPGNGIMIQAAKTQLDSIKLIYKNGQETITTPIKN